MKTAHRRIALLSGASVTAIGVSERQPEHTVTVVPGDRVEVVSSHAYGRTTIHSVRRAHGQ